LGDDAPPSNEPTGGSRNAVILDERAGVFPVTETDSEKKNQNESGFPAFSQSEVLSPVVIGATSEVKNDSEDDEADDGQDLDRAGDAMWLSTRIGGFVLNQMATHAKTNSASPYAPICQSLVNA